MKKISYNRMVAYTIGILLLLTIIGLLFTNSAKGQVMEIFTNSLTSDYDSIMKRTDSEDRIWIIHHIHREDPLDNVQSRNRHYNKGTGNIPEGFYNGLRMSSLVDTSDYSSLKRSTSPYSCEISVDGNFVIQDDLRTLLNWDISIMGSGHKVFVYIVEDLYCGDWPNYIHQNVMKLMLSVDGTEFRNRLWLATLFQTEWIAEKCSVIFTVEDSQGKVIGAKQMSLKGSVTTGINTTQMKTESKVWPNPAGKSLKFSNNLTFLRMINAQGKIIKVNETEKNRLDVSNLRPGLYVIAFKEGRFIRFVKY